MTHINDKFVSGGFRIMPNMPVTCDKMAPVNGEQGWPAQSRLGPFHDIAQKSKYPTDTHVNVELTSIISNGSFRAHYKSYTLHMSEHIHIHYITFYHSCLYFMGLLPDTQNCGLRMRQEWRERFPRLCGLSDPDMHHGTCVTHVPWCMPGSLTNGFLWCRWWGKRSRHSRRMRNTQFYVSGKRPMLARYFWDYCIPFITISEFEWPCLGTSSLTKMFTSICTQKPDMHPIHKLNAKAAYI